MDKPKDYCQLKVVSRDTSYRAIDGYSKGTHASAGKFAPGRVVWINPAASGEPAAPVSAYAEGVGIVALEADCLFA